MKIIVALLLAFVAPAEAFVPSTSCRGVIASSRTRAAPSTLLRAKKKAKNKTRGTEKTGTVFLPTPVPQGKDAFSAAPTFEEFLKFKQAERGETELKFP